MKTNIRLFVPNTTEALDFEYGLVVHYMQNNDSKKGHAIGLQYYELAEIEPVNNALDIVEQKTLTEVSRNQSKIDGFTLDSHYALSFDQRFNNRIDADSVRQVWLWLHCKNSEDYPFLLERITDSEEKMLSQQNQLLVRLWAHPDWTAREIQPPAPHTVSNQAELLSTLKQRLSVHFDQIEKVNRQKALAELDLKIATTPALVAPIPDYKPKPIINNIQNLSEKSITPIIFEKELTLEEKFLVVLQGYSASNFYIRGYISTEKIKNACASYPVHGFERPLALFDTSISGDAKTGMLIGMKGLYLKNNWPAETPKSFVSWDELSFVGKPVQNFQNFDIFLTKECNFNIFCFDDNTGMESYAIIDLLNRLIFCYKQHNGLVDQTNINLMVVPKSDVLDAINLVSDFDTLFAALNDVSDAINPCNYKANDSFDESNAITTSISSEEYEISSKPETPVYVAIHSDAPAPMEQKKTSIWWIWPVIIIIGFGLHPTMGGMFIGIAIFWYLFKFILSPTNLFLCCTTLITIVFAMFYFSQQ